MSVLPGMCLNIFGGFEMIFMYRLVQNIPFVLACGCCPVKIALLGLWMSVSLDKYKCKTRHNYRMNSQK